MNILGVAFLSDASACVLRDGRLVAAVSEERVNRVKLWDGFPSAAIAEVLELAGLSLDEIDVVATHGKTAECPQRAPFTAKERAIAEADLDADVKQAQIDALWRRYEHEAFVMGTRTPRKIAAVLGLGRKTLVYAHHQAHAASALYAVPWDDDGFVLTADGWGEDGSATLWQLEAGRLRLMSATPPCDSLGYFYGSITAALGFQPHRHEGKVLGLAALCPDPQSYAAVVAGMVDYDPRTRQFVLRMENGYAVPGYDNRRLAASVFRYSREDWAAAAQRRLEEVVCRCVSDLPGSRIRLAVAGGIFANVKLNQRLRELPNVREVFPFPNMGDGGLSVGAAYLAHVECTGTRPAALEDVYLGGAPTASDVRQAIQAHGVDAVRCDDVAARAGELLAAGEMVAVCHGAMEFGPRALGHRSILFHAQDARVNQWLNARLGRSEFMPFAPATLAEHAATRYVGISDAEAAARFMTMTFTCTDTMRREAPAAVHVDGTARPQLVSRDQAAFLHRILTRYHELTGVPTVVNTSFNMHEEPIVRSADDALRAFKAAKLPYLVLGDHLVRG